ncbi:MAG: T9SS C-terminal target domain-containing protein [Bacteroidetes bacterium]|nr:MAG: T9SS C-terminal target domain-containing protein [Bacteroidota bacterium]
MKKIYVLLGLLAMTSGAFAQIGLSWRQFLPLDFQTNPYQRETVYAHKISDGIVTYVNSLEELWGLVPDSLTYVIDGWGNPTARDFSSGSAQTINMPAQDAADYYGQYTLMAGDMALYVLFRVEDNEIDPDNGDKLELAFAPYADAYDPGRTIYPNTTHSRFNADSNAYNMGGGIWIPSSDYVEMAKWGSWTEAGSYKVDLPLASNDSLFAGSPIYTLTGANSDTLGDVSFASTHEPLQTLYEPGTGVYYYLAIVPWSVMYGFKLENPGDAMTVCPKVNDFDSDNATYQNNQGATVTFNYGYWSQTDKNDVYFAIPFYGPRVELVEVTANTSIGEQLNSVIKAFYAADRVHISHNQGDIDVNIFDLRGAQVRALRNAPTTLDVSTLAPGVYMADIIDQAGNRSMLKFMKQN